MLQEHYRCVPEIIQFSNQLSYDGKIKPLRLNRPDAQAIYLHQVHGHCSKNKINTIEAEAIVTLVQSLVETTNDTIGIIAMAGTNQSKYIEKKLLEVLTLQQLQSHKIRCGTPAQFQGDERDIIILSLVDSNESTKPLNTLGFGAEDTNKKRYNVAVSRSKNQLHIVHSLDITKDLKPNDLRYQLLSYAQNPTIPESASKSASTMTTLEKDLHNELSKHGYHAQPLQLGNHHIALTLQLPNRNFALLCLSPETKPLKILHQQTLLQRLSWETIFVRASQYYRNPEATVSQIENILKQDGNAI